MRVFHFLPHFLFIMYTIKVGRLRLRLRLVRPESADELFKQSMAADIAAAAASAGPLVGGGVPAIAMDMEVTDKTPFVF